jgi:phosphoribosyl 1,2-cyclic phosphodiesterase
MERLRIDPSTINTVFITHSHWDHIGGLADFLRIHPNKYLPAGAGRVVDV